MPGARGPVEEVPQGEGRRRLTVDNRFWVTAGVSRFWHSTEEKTRGPVQDRSRARCQPRNVYQGACEPASRQIACNGNRAGAR